jgi:hypothetical protein
MKKILLLLNFVILIETIVAQSDFYSADDLYSMALENSSGLLEKTARERAALY